MQATKEQERKALNKIKNIIEGLGPDSYVGAAFEGCFEIAESNIQNDFLESMIAKYEKAATESAKYRADLFDLRNKLSSVQDEKQLLEKKLDKALEWNPYTSEKEVTQEKYDALSKAPGCQFLSDEAAQKLLYDWFGFAKEKIHIKHNVPVYQKNRYGALRITGEADRKPCYYATDWNYIRFECVGVNYELSDGSLNII